MLCRSPFVRRALLVGVLAQFLYAGQASSDGIILGENYTIPPSQLTNGGKWTATDRFSCYDIRDGRRLNCQFTHKVIGLTGNGGHTHDVPTHPLIYPADGKL